MVTCVHARFLLGFVLFMLIFCVVFCRSLFVLYNLAIVLSRLIPITASDYTFSIFKLFFCLSFFNLLVLITPMAYSNSSFFVCPSSRFTVNSTTTECTSVKLVRNTSQSKLQGRNSKSCILKCMPRMRDLTTLVYLCSG